jgi:hypothetical protein
MEVKTIAGLTRTLALLAAAVALAPQPAAATLDDAPTYWQRTLAADLVVHARVVSGAAGGHLGGGGPSGGSGDGNPAGGTDRAAAGGGAGGPAPGTTTGPAFLEADVLEVLRGAAAPGPLRFVRHGLEIPPYERGDEVVLFLRRIERSAALAGAETAPGIAWASLEGTMDKVLVPPASRDAWLGAMRAYAGVAALGIGAAERSESLRRVTIQLLGSPELPLAISAARDLERAGDVPLINKQEIPELQRLLESARTPIAVRIAIVAALERRGLAFGPWHWARLLRGTRGADRLAVVRAVRTRPSAAVTKELVPLLEAPDRELAAAAAHSLGAPGNHRAVEPLARALGLADPELRAAAIQALGRVGTQSARHALELAAAYHPDAEVRRLAAGGAVALARRHGTTLAPMVAPEGALSTVPPATGAGARPFTRVHRGSAG